MTAVVSVVMSILNGEEFLAPALDSIFNQTFSDFELVVIDNGSVDRTSAILDGYSDERLKRLRNDKTLTLTASLNRGIGASTGQYIARLDADDVAQPERLAEQVTSLEADPRLALVGSRARLIDAADRPIGAYEPSCDFDSLRQEMSYRNPFAHSTVMFRRTAIDAVGAYPSAYSFAQDYGLWLNFALAGLRFSVLRKPLVDLRLHSGQSTYSAEYRLLRHSETIELLQKARGLNGLSIDSLKRNSMAQAHEYLRLSAASLSCFHPFAATQQLVRGVRLNPGVLMSAGSFAFRRASKFVKR